MFDSRSTRPSLLPLLGQMGGGGDATSSGGGGGGGDGTGGDGDGDGDGGGGGGGGNGEGGDGGGGGGSGGSGLGGGDGLGEAIAMTGADTTVMLSAVEALAASPKLDESEDCISLGFVEAGTLKVAVMTTLPALTAMVTSAGSMPAAAANFARRANISSSA